MKELTAYQRQQQRRHVSYTVMAVSGGLLSLFNLTGGLKGRGLWESAGWARLIGVILFVLTVGSLLWVIVETVRSRRS